MQRYQIVPNYLLGIIMIAATVTKGAMLMMVLGNNLQCHFSNRVSVAEDYECNSVCCYGIFATPKDGINCGTNDALVKQ